MAAGALAVSLGRALVGLGGVAVRLFGVLRGCLDIALFMELGGHLVRLGGCLVVLGRFSVGCLGHGWFP